MGLMMGLAFVALGLIIFIPALAQPQPAAEIQFFNESPLVGEPALVVLRAFIPRNAEPVEPITMDGWPVLEAGETRIREEGGQKVVERDFTLIFWQPITWDLPPVSVAYRLSADEVTTVSTGRISVTVPSVLIPGDLNFRPLRDPYGVVLPNPVQLALFALGLILVLFALYRLRDRWLYLWYSLRRAFRSPDAPMTASEVIKMLDALVRRNLPARVKYEQAMVYTRRYLMYRLDASIAAMTTYELVTWLLRSRNLDSMFVGEIQQLLDESDIVRFSPYAVDDTDFVRHVGRIKNFIYQLEAAIEQREKEAAEKAAA